MRPIETRTMACLSGVCALVICMAAFAQSYPSKPIRLIVPYGPGGPTDTTARIFGQQVAESTGQQVLVENRPGASTVIGMEACAKAAPDGHTSCIAVDDSLSYNPYLFKTLPYDPYKDFAPVIYLARGNSLVVASSKLPFSSYRGLVAFAKSNPGKLNWATWGAGTTPDIYLKWINRREGLNIVGIPYKGSPAAMSGILSGEIDMTFTSIGFALPQIKAGKIRPIAIVGTRRSPVLPDVPTLADEGADPGLGSYFGLFAPARTPKPVIDALNAEFSKAMRTRAVQGFLRAQSLDPVGGTASEFADFIKTDQANAGKLFNAIGIRPRDAPS